MSIKRPQLNGMRRAESYIEMCDYERDYVHELQRILFSYFKNDVDVVEKALKKINDKDGKISEQFKKEIRGHLGIRGGWLDFFHRREIMGRHGIKDAMDSVMLFHEKLEDIKRQINEHIKDPEDKIPLVEPFYIGIHMRGSPRSPKYRKND